MSDTVILGGGVTGLAAGVSSGCPVYEARPEPGGICASYYVKPGGAGGRVPSSERATAYRFEFGGGHWLFGGDPAVLALIRRLTPVQSYTRNSAVYLARMDRFAPFPLQYHLSHLPPRLAGRAVKEISASTGKEVPFLRDWLYDRFGPTLCELFFAPFHERYTAGLWTRIAPQDDFKSPVRLEEVRRGAAGQTVSAGYNTRFLYPIDGLDALAGQMARRSKIFYNKEVAGIDLGKKLIRFRDGTESPYRRILSTLPLCVMGRQTGLDLGESEPYTSVLVLNIGAIRGKRCPPYHWLYVPDSRSGFHRVGFYSNVDPSFLPAASPSGRVSLYIEFAYPGGVKPSDSEVAALAQKTTEELISWQFIEEAEVLDPTWIEVAYTWTIPGSGWKQAGLAALASHEIHQVGRYGRWIFQGIADSIRDGLMTGAAFRIGGEEG